MGSAGYPRRAHIVALDDDREMGAWLVDLLTEEGYTAEAYQQGTDLLATLEHGSPDLLITRSRPRWYQGYGRLASCQTA